MENRSLTSLPQLSPSPTVGLPAADSFLFGTNSPRREDPSIITTPKLETIGRRATDGGSIVTGLNDISDKIRKPRAAMLKAGISWVSENHHQHRPVTSQKGGWISSKDAGFDSLSCSSKDDSDSGSISDFHVSGSDSRPSDGNDFGCMASITKQNAPLRSSQVLNLSLEAQKCVLPPAMDNKEKSPTAISVPHSPSLPSLSPSNPSTKRGKGFFGDDMNLHDSAASSIRKTVKNVMVKSDDLVVPRMSIQLTPTEAEKIRAKAIKTQPIITTRRGSMERAMKPIDAPQSKKVRCGGVSGKLTPPLHGEIEKKGSIKSILKHGRSRSYSPPPCSAGIEVTGDPPNVLKKSPSKVRFND